MGLLAYLTWALKLCPWLEKSLETSSNLGAVKPKRVRTPTLLQMEVVECGSTSLGIVLGYYGRIVPLTELRVECGVSRDGSNASNILKAARRYGMEAKGYKKPLETVMELPLPFIVFWNFNHFLVVEGCNRKYVFLNDPATGPRRISWQEFDEGYTGIALKIQPGEKFQPGGRKKSVILGLIGRLRGSWRTILYCIIVGFLLVIPGLAVPAFSQIFVDEILIEGRTHWLRPLLLAMLVILVLQGGLKLLQLNSLKQLKIKLAMEMSTEFMQHLLHLPARFYAQRYAGGISSRLLFNNKVAEVLSGQLATTLIDATMVIFYALVMFAYDWLLTVIGISFALMNILALQWVARQRKDTNARLTYDEGKVAGIEISGLQSIETLKASALESDFFARWSGSYAKAINGDHELGKTNQLLSILPTLLTTLTTALILAIGGWRVMTGYLSMGMLVAFQTLMTSFQEPVNTLVRFASLLQELEGEVARLDDVLGNPIDQDLETVRDNYESFTLNAQPLVKLQGYVELKNIAFGYSQVNAPLISNFNLYLKPGQRVALVGGSGSGKSTIAKLICGLYQPWEGEILFDGIARTQIPRSVLTNSIAMVEQDIFLFGGTVRENLTLWDKTLPISGVIKGCEDAEINEAVLCLPGGYEAKLIEGGVNLSGGQRQRLEIARALVNNPAILVLDEATSALDAEIERQIDQNLRRRGCTCIIVAHRLSTIRDCDEIIVLDRGQVVQRGTHEQLWQEGGVYGGLISLEG